MRRPNFGEIAPSTAEIIASGFGKQAAILKFYFLFDFVLSVVIAMSFCIDKSNFTQIKPTATYMYL